MAAELTKLGWRLVSGGTDNHLMLVDVGGRGMTGRDASTTLDKVRITVNKNAIPFDTRSPAVASGIRLGTPAVTTRGMQESEMRRIARLIDRALLNMTDEPVLASVRTEVEELTQAFPLYPQLRAAMAQVS